MEKLRNSIHPDMFDNSNDIRHKRLLKFFTFSSFLSMILILISVGLSIHILFNNFLLKEAENDAIKIGLALLEQEREVLIDTDKIGNKYLNIDSNELKVFDKRVRKSLNLFRIAKLKIYTPKKLIIYSTDSEIIGISDPMNNDLRLALTGEISSKLESSIGLWDLTEERIEGSEMVETYLPIRTQTGRIRGVYEIYMDVSSYRKNANHALIAIIGLFIVILIMVFGLLRVFMNRAIKTIYAKSRDIRVLKGLLPICSSCKKIRDDKGNWENLEKYITSRTASQFSHSLCPDCRREQYPDI